MPVILVRSLTFLNLILRIRNSLAQNTEMQPLLWCYKENISSSDGLLPEFNGLMSNRSPIFFIDSSCKSAAAKKITLSPREACAIESTVRTNAGSDIYVLFTAQVPLNVNLLYSDPVVSELEKYQKIYYRYVNVYDLLNKTIRGKWRRLDDLLNSKFAMMHISDILRLFVLHKYGGTYLDLDVVTMTSLNQLGNNYAGAENRDLVNTAVLNFKRHGISHKIIRDYWWLLKEKYDPESPANTTAGLPFTQVLKSICEVKRTGEMTRHKCHGFRVYPEEYFYPVQRSDWRNYFIINEHAKRLTNHVLQRSKLIHIWNYFSSNETVQKGSPYAVVAERFCPNIFKHIVE